ncbi:uncharacterized protein [Chironomus tepperi]|uniref:uncharacterized protein n=1 Tax=Chironomus tepperi TaxID=113505 RepID=UPI00391F6465
MELNYLINIVNDLINRFECPILPFEYELKKELVNLNSFEKQIIRNKINSISYNIGALNVLKILKECDVCSISDYLGSINNEYEKLQIVTEILDDKDSYILFEELIDSNRFEDLIDMSIKNYVNDLIHRQDIIQNEIIMSTHELLPADHFTKSILPKFLNNLFHLDFKSPKELIEVISNQNDWNLEFRSFRVLRNVIDNIMPLYNSLIVKEICNLINSEKEICWFFILMIVNYIKDEYDGYVELKNLILTQITAFCETNSLHSLYKSLILARQLYHYTANIKKQTYQQWLKHNIGDLNYKLKNKSSFTDIMSSLENLIPFENDLEIVKIHISVQISAPSKEYSNVLAYKQLLRSREEVLMRENTELSQMFDD